MAIREHVTMTAASQPVWHGTALALVKEHGSEAVYHCIQQMHALVEMGRPAEALMWIDIAYATADLVAKLNSSTRPAQEAPISPAI